MAALTPAISTINTPALAKVEVQFAPNPESISWGVISIPTLADGYVYEPPTVGQLWPRGDYAPRGA